MDSLNEMIDYLLILIPIGALARIVYCCCAMAADSDEDKSYKVRIRNTLVFTALAEGIMGFINLIISYF